MTICAPCSQPRVKRHGLTDVAPQGTIRPSTISIWRSAPRANCRVVGYDKDAPLAMCEVAQDVVDVLARFRVERTGRLVGNAPWITTTLLSFSVALGGFILSSVRFAPTLERAAN